MLVSTTRRRRRSFGLPVFALVVLPLTVAALFWWLSAHAFGGTLMAVPLLAYCIVILLRPQ